MFSARHHALTRKEIKILQEDVAILREDVAKGFEKAERFQKDTERFQNEVKDALMALAGMINNMIFVLIKSIDKNSKKR